MKKKVSRGLDLEKYKVPVEELRWTYKPESPGKKIPTKLSEIIGQERANKAIEFGLSMGDTPGYNIIVVGPERVGKFSTVKEILEDKVKKLSANLIDQCAVYNFDEPDIPLILTFEAGKGIKFKDDINKIITDLYDKIPQLISEENLKNKKSFEEKFNDTRSKLLSKLKSKKIPYKISDLTSEINLNWEIYENEIDLEINSEAQEYNSEIKKAYIENDKKESEFLVKKLVDIINNSFRAVKSNYSDKKVLSFFEKMQKDMLTDPIKVYRFSKLPKSVNELFEHDDYLDTEKIQKFGKNFIERYLVNLIVDNSKTKNIPVIFENNPTYSNVIGTILGEGIIRIEEENNNHLKVRAGSLIKANNGIVVLNADELLLKEDLDKTLDAILRSIKDAEIEIENQRSENKTDLAKAKTKIIMLGSYESYDLLREYFSKFDNCFKVKAEFSDTIENNEENRNKYRGFFNIVIARNNLKPLDDSAIAQLLEYAARYAQEKAKLTAKVGLLADIIKESDAFAKNDTVITSKHILRALENRLDLDSLIEEKELESIKNKYKKVDFDGAKVGEINGLEVFESKHFFGTIFKLIVRVSLADAGGNEELVNIDHEVGYSDANLDKGMLVLYSYLKGKHAKDKPMPLNISISNAQGEFVGGHSATLASGLAFYSDLTGIPIKQNIAVTGFLNESGDALFIGCVNEKIEGFYKTCKSFGVKDCGIVIPKSNVQDLMLNEEVIKAVKTGNLSIYKVDNIDEAKEVVMDKKASTINKIADAKIEEANYKLARLRR